MDDDCQGTLQATGVRAVLEEQALYRRWKVDIIIGITKQSLVMADFEIAFRGRMVDIDDASHFGRSAVPIAASGFPLMLPSSPSNLFGFAAPVASISLK